MVCRHTDWTDCSEYLPSVKTNNSSSSSQQQCWPWIPTLGQKHCQETSWTQRVFPTGKIIRYLIVLIIVTCDLCHILDITLQHTVIKCTIQKLSNNLQTNVTRGLVAAVICAVLFIILFVAERFLQKRYRLVNSVRCTKWRHISMSRSDSQNIASYNRETGRVTMRGMDNMGLSKDQWTQFSWN